MDIKECGPIKSAHIPIRFGPDSDPIHVVAPNRNKVKLLENVSPGSSSQHSSPNPHPPLLKLRTSSSDHHPQILVHGSSRILILRSSSSDPLGSSSSDTHPRILVLIPGYSCAHPHLQMWLLRQGGCSCWRKDVLLPQGCCSPAAAALLLQRCCCSAAAAALLLQPCCCNITLTFLDLCPKRNPIYARNALTYIYAILVVLTFLEETKKC